MTIFLIHHQVCAIDGYGYWLVPTSTLQGRPPSPRTTTHIINLYLTLSGPTQRTTPTTILLPRSTSLLHVEGLVGTQSIALSIEGKIMHFASPSLTSVPSLHFFLTPLPLPPGTVSSHRRMRIPQTLSHPLRLLFVVQRQSLLL